MHASVALVTAVCALALPVADASGAAAAKPPPAPRNGADKSPFGYGAWAERPSLPPAAASHRPGHVAGPGGGAVSDAPDGDPNGGPVARAFGVVEGPAAATPAQMALFVSRSLRLPLPGIRTAPPRGDRGVVGLRHFFWADRARWRPLTARAQAGPVWAEVTAVPSRLVIRPGDGATVSCNGPGKPYDFGRSPDAQDIRCTHLYERSSAGLKGSAYKATAEVVWTATWVGSGGTGGALPPTTRSETFPVQVAEGQALTQRSA